MILFDLVLQRKQQKFIRYEIVLEVIVLNSTQIIRYQIVHEAYYTFLMSSAEITDYLKVSFCVRIHENIALLKCIF